MSPEKLALLLAEAGGSGAYADVVTLSLGLGMYGGAIFALAPALLDARIVAAGSFSANELITANSALFAGWGVGSVVLSALADRVGRKVVTVRTAFAAALCGAVAALSSSSALLVGARALCGVCLGGMSGMGYALLVEVARTYNFTFEYRVNVLKFGTHHRPIERNATRRASRSALVRTLVRTSVVPGS